MTYKLGAVDELLTLEEIEAAEETYYTHYGAIPFSLSTWDPSDFYRNNFLLNRVEFPVANDLIDFISYIYYYELDPAQLSLCKQKLFGRENGEIVLTNSGTASIALISSVLSAMGLRCVLVISPAYFAVFHNCIQKQLDVKELHMIHRNGRYSLPREAILDMYKDIDAVWITSPIYNTGVYLCDEDIDFLIKEVEPSKLIIADECFCSKGREIARRFPNNSNFIGICDPMKQFLINGAKFSAITIPDKLSDLFCHWSDVVCGCLTTSTIQAINFFLSPAADQLLAVLQKADKGIQNEVRSIAKNYNKIELDRDIDGHMMMCYIPSLPSSCLHTYRDFCKFQTMTGSSIIPGTRFHFSNGEGFAFRINLSRYDPVFFARSMNRVLTYLSSADFLMDYHPLISQ